MTLIIGLTGGIGCGKSTALHCFSHHNIPTLDADHVAKELVSSPEKPAFQEITRCFGPHICTSNGVLNRHKLRQLIFNSPQKRRQLEAILHPKVRQQIQQWSEQVRAPYAIVCIPLLFETAPYSIIRRTLVIDLPESLQITRTITRDQTNSALVKKIMAQQVNRYCRLALANDIIDNRKDTQHLKNQVHNYHIRYQRLSRCQRQKALAK